MEDTVVILTLMHCSVLHVSDTDRNLSITDVHDLEATYIGSLCTLLVVKTISAFHCNTIYHAAVLLSVCMCVVYLMLCR